MADAGADEHHTGDELEPDFEDIEASILQQKERERERLKQEEPGEDQHNKNHQNGNGSSAPGEIGVVQDDDKDDDKDDSDGEVPNGQPLSPQLDESTDIENVKEDKEDPVEPPASENPEPLPSQPAQDSPGKEELETAEEPQSLEGEKEGPREEAHAGVAQDEVVPSPTAPVSAPEPSASIPAPSSELAAKDKPKQKKDDCTLFVLRAFRAMLFHLNIKKYVALKEAMQEVIIAIDSPCPPATLKLPGTGTDVLPVQAYTHILRTACETNEPKVLPIALDCMQKMMSFGEVSDDVLGSLPMITFAKKTKMPMPPKDDQEDHPWKGRKVGLLSEMVSAICTCANATTVPVTDSVQLQTLKGLLTAVTERGVHDWAMRLAVSTIFTVSIKQTATTVNSATAKTTLTQVTNWVFQRMEAVSAIMKELASGASVDEHKFDLTCDPETKLTVYHSDAAHVIRMLCGMIDSVIVTEYTPPEAVEMKIITTALELLQNLIGAAGPGFKETRPFIDAIREPLLTSLVKCCVSPVPSVTLVALNISNALIFSFKHCLKHEIGLLYTNVILKILESPHSNYDQKIYVAQALGKILGNPQVVVDIYVNYDCDMNQGRVFESILNGLSHFIMAQHQELDWITQKQDLTMKAVALQDLVASLKSMEQWVKKCRDGDDRISAAPFVVPGIQPAIFTAVEKQRKTKALLEEAAAAFTHKPHKGLRVLVQHGLAEDTPAGIAKALEELKLLERSAVGEYLGDEGNTDVLKEFCSSTDYSTMTLDGALRVFLSRFTLPKEGQKIERILEYFAAAFFETNKASSCLSDEAVFVLSVGIVMLNTDLHNPKVDKKMSKEKFKSQFRGVNAGQDFDSAYLEAIYDSILRNPMKDVQQLAGSIKEVVAEGGFLSAFTSKRDKKIAAYTAEAQRLSNQTQLLLYEASGGLAYSYAVDIEHIKPMFGVCWAAMLACFSRHFESEETPSDVIKVCIEGICRGIHISACFELHTEREAFVRALCSMTNTADSRRIIQPKNLAAIKAFLKVPFVDSDALYASWLPYLRTVSEIQHLRALGLVHKQRGTAEKEAQVSDPKKPSAGNEQQNAREVMVNIDEHSIHKIISYSTVVSQAGLKEFVCHLCTVALEEVNLRNTRTFLLEKVVEVASDNMGPRILSIWKDITHLLVAVGTHPNSDVAEYGVDNLRQLVMKSIGRKELVNCMIQPELIEPFLGIMESSLPTKQVRDLILRCLAQLVQAKASQIGPGWPVIMRVLVAGITRHKEQSALEMSAQIMREMISPDNMVFIAPYIEDVVFCLTFVAADTKLNPEMSSTFAEILAELPVQVAELQADNGASEAAWCRVFDSFLFLFLDPSEETRARAIKALGKSLCRQDLPPSVWGIWSTRFAVSSVVQPLFGFSQLSHAECYMHLRHHNVMSKIERADQKEWVAKTLPLVMQHLIVEPLLTNISNGELIHHVPNIVAVISRVAKRESMREVHLAMRELQAVLDAAVPCMGADEWHVTMLHLRSLFKHSLIRTSHLKPHMTSSLDYPDPVNNCTSFPAALELCPQHLRHHLTEPPPPLDHINHRPVSRTPSGSSLRHHSSSSLGASGRSRGPNQSDDRLWVTLLYGYEDTLPGSGASYTETENNMLEDLSIRCARQAGLVSLLETVLLGKGRIDWCSEDSKLSLEDFEELYRCIRHSFETANVFFSDSLQAWRATVSPQIVEMVRRRRSKAVQLNINILFQGYCAPRHQIRQQVRQYTVPDCLEILQHFKTTTEAVSLEPAVIAMLRNMMSLPTPEFLATSCKFYTPVCECIPLDSSQLLRQVISEFLICCNPAVEQ